MSSLTPSGVAQYEKTSQRNSQLIKRASHKLMFKPLRPHEFAFTAEERSTVIILFGGPTWKHERLIDGLLAGAGYRCQHLPETDRAAHELGNQLRKGLVNPLEPESRVDTRLALAATQQKRSKDPYWRRSSDDD